MPQDWLSANVCPVYKKGKRSLPINYRPISLTSVACKTLEHIIAHNIMRHIDMHKILKPYQHGFLKHHSCESQLINTSEEIMRHLDQVTGGQIDILVLDFSKAFDLVSHKKLLTKLDHYGVRGKTLNWLNGWISKPNSKSSHRWGIFPLYPSYLWSPTRNRPWTLDVPSIHKRHWRAD